MKTEKKTFKSNWICCHVLLIKQRFMCCCFLYSSGVFVCRTRKSILMLSRKLPICSLQLAFIWMRLILTVWRLSKTVHHVSIKIQYIYIHSYIYKSAVPHFFYDEIYIFVLLPLFTAYIQVLLRRYEFNEVSLRCLASRCIAQHKIPYKGIVPKQLEMFIETHSSEKN